MLMFTKYKIFHIILSKLKGNGEEGDNVFDGVLFAQLARTPQDTGPWQRRKGGITDHRTLIPYLQSSF